MPHPAFPLPVPPWAVAGVDLWSSGKHDYHGGNIQVLNDAGQYAFYGRVGDCLITGNEDGIKHCAMNILYSLQHLGYTIPPQADAGWIGDAGPGPSYLDPAPAGRPTPSPTAGPRS